MTRRCADSVTATDIPVNDPTTGQPWALVLGYIDGRYTWSASDWNRFPNSRHVRVAVFSTTNDGDAIDRELGDATAAQAVDWVLMRRAAGHPAPIVYCSYSDWGNCKAAFDARGVTQPQWWIAGYPDPTDGQGNPIIPSGAIAHQFTDTPGGHWDESLVVDYLPGVDGGAMDWNDTISPDGLVDAAGHQVSDKVKNFLGYGDTFARQAKENTDTINSKVDAQTAKVDALTAAVTALTAKVDALAAAPTVTGTLHVAGDLTVTEG